MGLKTIAIYTEADRHSPYVNDADLSVKIETSYLDSEAVIAAAKLTGAQAIHPGYGFLSENHQFANSVQNEGIIWVGPDPKSIQVMGDKIEAKKHAVKSKIPILESVNDAKSAKDIGYPLMIKAAAGGGGKGMRIVHDESELDESIRLAKQEAKNAFGDDRIFIERFIQRSRHIEVQIIADKHDTVLHLGERECSIQRRHQKLIEESPSPLVDQDTRDKIGLAAVSGAKAVDYIGVGTIEFLMDKNKNFYFMEMNTRIQVEHPVTEMVTGVDLIKQQIRMHAGLKFSKNLFDIKLRGHSIECRINAEDPANNFLPFPSEILNFHMPGGKGVRVDSHAYAGYKIPTQYDSMIGKIIVHAKNREQAIKRMERALEESIITGPKTTIPYQLQIMMDDKFKSGTFDTSFLETFEYKTLKK